MEKEVSKAESAFWRRTIINRIQMVEASIAQRDVTEPRWQSSYQGRLSTCQSSPALSGNIGIQDVTQLLIWNGFAQERSACGMA